MNSASVTNNHLELINFVRIRSHKGGNRTMPLSSPGEGKDEPRPILHKYSEKKSVVLMLITVTLGSLIQTRVLRSTTKEH